MKYIIKSIRSRILLSAENKNFLITYSDNIFEFFFKYCFKILEYLYLYKSSLMKTKFLLPFAAIHHYVIILRILLLTIDL